MSINIASWLVASVAGFLLGWLWYSPKAFGTHWAVAQGMSADSCAMTKGEACGLRMGVSALMVVVKMLVLQSLMTHLGAVTPFAALTVALWIWAGFIATTSMGGVLWAGKPMKVYLINVTYELALLITGAVIFVYWH